MAEKSIKSRVQTKRGTSADWARAEAAGFKPLEGEFIFYTDLNKTKVGRYKDGTTDVQKKSTNHTDYLLLLSELSFLNANDADTLDGKHASDFALKTDVPTKTSELTNDSGFKTTDNNTTYDLAAAKSKSNGNVTIDLIAGGSGSGTDSVMIKGSGATTVTTDTNGVITINSTDTNTETTLAITDKANTDTTDLVYAITNLVEGGTKGHTLTPTYTGLPTKTYVDKMVTGTVEYLGTVSALTGLSTTAGKGDFYRVSTQFTFGSETAHVGDILLAIKDNPTQNATDWDLIHTEVDANTWVANSSTADGYVAKTNGAANKVWKTNASGVPSWQDDANTDTGATSVEVTGTGNAVTTASYDAAARKLTLTKGATYSSLTLGETSATAYQGDRGKIAYDHSQSTHAPSNAQKNSDITKAEIEAKLTGAIASHTHSTATTPPAGTNNTQIATTAFVKTELSNLISHGTADPSASTTSQYYFKYN